MWARKPSLNPTYSLTVCSVFLFILFSILALSPVSHADQAHGLHLSDLGSTQSLRHIAPFPKNFWSFKTAQDLTNYKKLLTELPKNISSPSLHKAVLQLLITPTPPKQYIEFERQRIKTLYIMGQPRLLISYMTKYLTTSQRQDPYLQLYYTKSLFVLGRKNKACGEVNKIPTSGPYVQKKIVAEVLRLVAYCAASLKYYDAALLSLTLAQEQGAISTLAFDVITHLMSQVMSQKKERLGLKENLHVPGLDIADYLFLKLGKWVLKPAHIKQLNFSILRFVAHDRTQPLTIRTLAIEHLVRFNVLPVTTLQDIYTKHRFTKAAYRTPLKVKYQDVQKRALLYQMLQKPVKMKDKVQYIRRLWSSFQKLNMRHAGSHLLSPHISTLLQDRSQASQLSLSEAGIAVLLYSKNIRYAANWIVVHTAQQDNARPSLMHWMLVIEFWKQLHQSQNIKRHINYDYDASQTFSPQALQRLATILFTMKFAVPDALWDALQKAPQLAKDQLPSDRLLRALQSAVQNGNQARGLSLIAQGLSTKHKPEHLHILEMRDFIGALSQLGLESVAKDLSFEMMLAFWPRRFEH